jgi:ssDNA-binding Zn-finger/Zn-ribbon topoisomerase 1
VSGTDKKNRKHLGKQFYGRTNYPKCKRQWKCRRVKLIRIPTIISLGWVNHEKEKQKPLAEKEEDRS